MKAAVVTEGGVEVRDVEKPKPGPEQVLVRVRAAGLNRADLQRGGRPQPRQHRRSRHRDGPRVLRRGRGRGERGQGREARRPRDVHGQRRLRRVCRCRLGPRLAGPRQQHELGAGGDPADRPADHAQRARHRRAAEGRRGGDDPGRQLGRRPDGPADRQAQGRAPRHRHVHQRRPARAAQGVRRRSRRRHQRAQLVGEGAGRHRQEGRRPHRRPGLGQRREREHEGRLRARAHRQRRPARRLQRASSTSTCTP